MSVPTPTTTPGRSGRATALVVVRRLRVGVLALCGAAVAVAWVYDLPVLLMLALVVAAEELLEMSVVIAVLRGTELERALNSSACAPPLSSRARP